METTPLLSPSCEIPKIKLTEAMPTQTPPSLPTLRCTSDSQAPPPAALKTPMLIHASNSDPNYRQALQLHQLAGLPTLAAPADPTPRGATAEEEELSSAEFMRFLMQHQNYETRLEWEKRLRIQHDIKFTQKNAPCMSTEVEGVLRKCLLDWYASEEDLSLSRRAKDVIRTVGDLTKGGSIFDCEWLKLEDEADKATFTIWTTRALTSDDFDFKTSFGPYLPSTTLHDQLLTEQLLYSTTFTHPLILSHLFTFYNAILPLLKNSIFYPPTLTSWTLSPLELRRAKAASVQRHHLPKEVTNFVKDVKWSLETLRLEDRDNSCMLVDCSRKQLSGGHGTLEAMLYTVREVELKWHWHNTTIRYTQYLHFVEFGPPTWSEWYQQKFGSETEDSLEPQTKEAKGDDLV